MELLASRSTSSLKLTKDLYEYCPKIYTRKHALMTKNPEVFTFLSQKVLPERLTKLDLRDSKTRNTILDIMKKGKKFLSHEQYATFSNWIEREVGVTIKETNEDSYGRPTFHCLTKGDALKVAVFLNSIMGLDAYTNYYDLENVYFQASLSAQEVYKKIEEYFTRH